MLPNLRAAVSPQCDVAAYTDLVGFIGLWRRAVESVAPDLVDSVGGHADLAETSEMLCIRPDLVDTSRAEAGLIQEFDQKLMDRIFGEGFRTVTPNGILGDARNATVEIGEACLAEAADGIVAALEG